MLLPGYTEAVIGLLVEECSDRLPMSTTGMGSRRKVTSMPGICHHYGSQTWGGLEFKLGLE